MSNVYKFGKRLVAIIIEEVAKVDTEAEAEHGADADGTAVSRDALIPTVTFRKRPHGRGREVSKMRVSEGITVSPLKPVLTPINTNERDGIGYKFLVSFVTGSYNDILDDTTELDWPNALWAEAVRRRLQNNRMGSLTLVDTKELRTSVRTGDLPDWAELDDGLDAIHLVVTEYVREGRRPSV
jgi:hypothetical protein